MRITDNNRGSFVLEGDKLCHIGNLQKIVNQKIADIKIEQHPDLLVFPPTLGQHHDDIQNSSKIFSLHGHKLTTYNIMGFVGINDTQLTICSRFDQDDNDYFLHYMLQKVFAINIFKFDQTNDKENIWDFLLYLFPYFLKKAFAQGLYKEYKRNEYNNANVKGAIDVKRHIRTNLPFAGKIAYSTREYSYDNSITQLIRHTAEYIKTHKFGNGILTADSDVIAHINQLNYATPSYNRNDRQRILHANNKPFVHPYFTEYKMLQKICLQILRYEKMTFGKEKDKIYGVLFDGAWLWEEYLNTILKDKFTHPENKTGKDKEYLFENNEQKIYPDFINKDGKIIADAKYKHLEYRNDEYGRNDYYQLITYMYRFNSLNGFLLFPHPEKTFREVLKIKETDGYLSKVGLQIPQKSSSFDDFKSKMTPLEKEFSEKITI
ncbi:5-methylcytosine-specific restriction enzyme subunit McrC [Bacteroidales bacterium Barb7]|nr:5-methylcytosine-specific restriction enzyme subunit McrC [Bacteroidales bacterium Barb7]